MQPLRKSCQWWFERDTLTVTGDATSVVVKLGDGANEADFNDDLDKSEVTGGAGKDTIDVERVLCLNYFWWCRRR